MQQFPKWAVRSFFAPALALAVTIPGICSFAMPSNSLHAAEASRYQDPNVLDSAYYAGTRTGFAQFAPWEAAVARLADSPSINHWKHGCSGTLVASQWILTARHCIPEAANYACFRRSAQENETCVAADRMIGTDDFKTYSDKFYLAAGLLNPAYLRMLAKAIGSSEAEIEKLVAPANKILFDIQNNSTRSDWGMVHLQTPAPAWVTPIAIAKAGEIREGQPAIVVGFPGYLDRVNLGAESKSINTRKVISDQCSIKKLAPLPTSDSIYSDCAMTHGSSGGPLLIVSNGQLKVAGINSAVGAIYVGRPEPAGDAWTLQTSSVWTNVMFYEPLLKVITAGN